MAIRKTVVLAVVSLALLGSSAAFAQEGPAWTHGEVSIQGTGFFTKDSQGNGVTQHSTDTGGFLIGYRYHFNRWFAAEANYGYARNTQQNVTAGGLFNVQANVHQATGAFVVTLQEVPGSTPTFWPAPARSCLIRRTMRANPCQEPSSKPRLHLSTEEEQTSRW